MFPKSIKEYVKNLEYRIDTIGRSEDEVYIFMYISEQYR